MTEIDSLQAALSKPDDRALGNELLRVLTASDAASLSAPEIAQAIRSSGDWHGLLAPIRRVAVMLAIEGRLVIYRKGKLADPMKFSGVYRIGLPRQD